MRYTALAVLALLVASLSAERRTELRPVDEAKSEPLLAQTRDELFRAVKDRSPDSVMRYISPNVVLQSVESNSGEGWTKIFNALSLKREQLAGATEHEYWDVLAKTLPLGGSFTTTRGAVFGRREFCAPYPYSAYPDGELPESVRGEALPWVLVRANVEIHAEPSRSARVLKRLSYSLLQVVGQRTEPSSGQKWQAVELSGDSDGFVLSDAIWDPKGYHVCFAKFDGRWLVSDFATRGQL